MKQFAALPSRVSKTRIQNNTLSREGRVKDKKPPRKFDLCRKFSTVDRAKTHSYTRVILGLQADMHRIVIEGLDPVC